MKHFSYGGSERGGAFVSDVAAPKALGPSELEAVDPDQRFAEFLSRGSTDIRDVEQLLACEFGEYSRAARVTSQVNAIRATNGTDPGDVTR